MKIFLTTIIFSLLFVFSEQVSFAQQLKENEIVVIKGEKFVMHQVRTGETIYSISKKYKIDRSVLEKYNPKIADGLSIGDILKIPYIEGADLSQAPVYQKGDPTGFKTHKIKSRKETPYFIAKQYGITVEELYAYNPSVRKFRRGVKLKIPYWTKAEEHEVAEEIAPEKTAVSGEMKPHYVVSGETLYSISKKYNVSESEILFYNPDAKKLKAGMVINIPLKETPVVSEEKISEKYFEHIIESGETMWRITRKYGVSEEELKALNPILNTGFQAGTVIRIPVSEIEKTAAKPVNEGAFKQYIVEKGETLYGLSKKFGLTIPEIIKYNPVLETRSLVYGETILIPEKPDEVFMEIVSSNKVDSARLVEKYYEVELPVEIPPSCMPGETGMFTSETYNIVLFLPLFLETNDTLNREDPMVLDTLILSGTETLLVMDTTKVKDRKELFKQFYGNTENFVQFYEGVLLAVDLLQKSGLNIRLNVFDTQRKADSIRQFIFDEKFLETDLIIGPIYQNVQKEVAQIAAKNRIPIVSPLASQSAITSSNPSYFQVNPSREYISATTAEMVAEEYYNSNFIVVKTSNYEGTQEGRLVDLFREKFFNSGFMSENYGVNFTVYDFEHEGPSGLRRIMSRTKENVVYIPTSDEGELSIATSNVNNLADDFSITLIGTSRFPNYSSIQIDYFHNLKLKYIAPYWTDYSNPSTIKFVEKFKSNFATEPNNFGMQGYDVTLYFMKALTTYGSNFDDCLPYLHINQVQGNYHFEKVTQYGGYMNQGVSVISYTRDYEVVRKRVKGQPKLVSVV
ncbi:MAG: LysM peptidoglycan-binding domain-containing protein, partial [Bacteroidota bacterium]